MNSVMRSNVSWIYLTAIIDMTDTTYTLEVTGDSEKIDAVLKALEHITMLEVVRSGQLGMGRGDKGMV